MPGPSSTSPHRVGRRTGNTLKLPGALAIIVPLDPVFVNAVDVDEATLASADGAYRKTLRVIQESKKVDDEHVQLVFLGVVPGKKYTLTYDTKLDADESEVANLVMFDSRLIGADDLQKGIRKEIPFPNEKDGDVEPG